MFRKKWLQYEPAKVYLHNKTSKNKYKNKLIGQQMIVPSFIKYLSGFPFDRKIVILISNEFVYELEERTIIKTNLSQMCLYEDNFDPNLGGVFSLRYKCLFHLQQLRPWWEIFVELSHQYLQPSLLPETSRSIISSSTSSFMKQRNSSGRIQLTEFIFSVLRFTEVH